MKSCGLGCFCSYLVINYLIQQEELLISEFFCSNKQVCAYRILSWHQYISSRQREIQADFINRMFFFLLHVGLENILCPEIRYLKMPLKLGKWAILKYILDTLGIFLKSLEVIFEQCIQLGTLKQWLGQEAIWKINN